MKKKEFSFNLRTYGYAFWHCLLEKLLLLFVVFLIYIVSDILGPYTWIAVMVGLLLLCAYRFFLSHCLARVVDSERMKTAPLNPFSRLLPAACLRLVSGGIWGLPFALLAYQLYRYVAVLDVTVWNKDFTSIGAFVLSDAARHIQMYTGMLIFFGALLAAFLLFVYGWRRGMAFEFMQMKGYTLSEALRRARKARKNARIRLFSAFWMHVAFCLPAVAAPFLLPYLQLAPLLSGKLMNDLTLTYAYLKAGILSGDIFVQAALLFVALYLPLLPLRKLNNAKAVMYGYAKDAR